MPSRENTLRTIKGILEEIAPDHAEILQAIDQCESKNDPLFVKIKHAIEDAANLTDAGLKPFDRRGDDEIRLMPGHRRKK